MIVRFSFTIWFLFGSSWVMVFFCSPWVGSVGLVFLSTSRVVELLFPPGPRLDPVDVDLPLAFLGYGGLFICFSFVLAELFISRCLHWGVAESTCRRRDDFWPVFSHFFFDFGSQIYTSSLTFDWHAPPSRVLRRLPLQDLVMSVAGDWRMVPMRLGALCCLVRVWATLHLFSGRARWQPVIRHRTSVWVAPVSARVFHAPSFGPLLHCRLLVLGGFLLRCSCIFFSCFSGHCLLVFDSNFMGIFVGSLLNHVSFL
jgi:hypothetical protein